MYKLTKKNEIYKNKPLNSTVHATAVFSICFYIIGTVVFEFTQVATINIASISIYLCLLCCAFDCLVKNRLRFDWLFVALVVFGIVISISILYTPASSQITGPRIYRYWTSVVLAFLASNVITDIKDIKTIIAAFIISGVALSVYIYMYFGISNLLALGSRIENGPFGNVNTVGLNCAFSISLAFYAMIAFKWNKFSCFIAAVVCLPCLMFSGSRKAFLSLIICMLVFVFVYLKNVAFVKKVFLCLCILAFFVLVLYFIPAFKPIKERLFGFLDIFEGVASVAGDSKRLLYISEGIKAFLGSPIIGKGFCYSYYLLGTYTHNNYVELLMCHGVVGFLAYYLIYVRIVKDAIKIKGNRQLSTLVLVIIAKMLFEHIGVVDYYARMTLLTLAIITSSIKISRNNKF